MKAATIVLRDMQGQIAGAIVHAGDCHARLAVLHKVSEDISTGVSQLDGLNGDDAEALLMALGRELEAMSQLLEQLRLVDAYGRILASKLPGCTV
jgi:hypothetical protein